MCESVCTLQVVKDREKRYLVDDAGKCEVPNPLCLELGDTLCWFSYKCYMFCLL